MAIEVINYLEIHVRVQIIIRTEQIMY